MTDKDNKGSMTVAEAGRKGGETVRNERGREFYETIGRKGGATVKAERGRAFYEEIGRKGGETVKAERGAKFYEEIGKKGGDRVKATRGPNFYEEIGRKGGQKVKKLIEEGKRAARDAAAAAHRHSRYRALQGLIFGRGDRTPRSGGRAAPAAENGGARACRRSGTAKSSATRVTPPTPSAVTPTSAAPWSDSRS